MASVFAKAGGAIASSRPQSAELSATDAFGHTSATSVLTEEARDRAALDLRRSRIEDRRERFLDARERTIGIDVEALDRQVAAKQAAKRAEREAELAYAEEQRRIARAIAEFEREVKGDKRSQQEATARELRRQLQVKHLADTADLNDKDALRKSRPTRDGDDDPRCGPASLQRFDGEDPYEADRAMMQAAQMREWCVQQQRAREAALAAEKEDDKEYAAYLESVGKMRDDVEAAIKRDAADRALAMKIENERMARERRELEKRAKERDNRFGASELETTARSGILAERLEDGISALGAHRRRPDHYRGMTPEEQAAWQKEVEAQRAEQAARAEALRKADAEAAAEQARHLREARRFEAQLAKEAEEERQRHLTALKVQQREQAARMEQEAREQKNLYIGRGFYDGFGQSDR